MTPERIAELRALAEAATPGPWHVGDGDVAVLTVEDEHVALVHQRYANSAFIAAARTALPEALAIIEAMHRVVDEFDTGERLDPDGGEHRLRREMARALFGSRAEPKDSSDGFYVSEALDAIERVRAFCAQRDIDQPNWGDCNTSEILAALEGKQPDRPSLSAPTPAREQMREG